MFRSQKTYNIIKQELSSMRANRSARLLIDELNKLSILPIKGNSKNNHSVSLCNLRNVSQSAIIKRRKKKYIYELPKLIRKGDNDIVNKSKGIMKCSRRILCNTKSPHAFCALQVFALLLLLVLWSHTFLFSSH